MNRSHVFIILFFAAATSLTACKSRDSVDNTLGFALDALHSDNAVDFRMTLSSGHENFRAQFGSDQSFQTLRTDLSQYESLRISSRTLVREEQGVIGNGLCGITLEVYDVAIMGDRYEIKTVEGKGKQQQESERVLVTDIPVLNATVECRKSTQEFQDDSLLATSQMQMGGEEGKTPPQPQPGKKPTPPAQTPACGQDKQQQGSTYTGQIYQRCEISNIVRK